MRGKPILAAILWHAVAASAPALALEPSVFVARSGVVHALRDLNADSDFFDFAEITPYAESLPSSAAALGRHNDVLYLVVNGPPRILVLADHNDDGDALDFAEVSEFAALTPHAPSIIGLAVCGDAEILTADPVNGTLLRVRDLNEDGDAFDTDEVTSIASDLTAPTALTAQPDGRVLVAQNSTPVPVRVLHDRDGDGDFFEFAENLSYAENFFPGRQILSRTNHLAFITRPVFNEVAVLDDRTADGDALDFAEVSVYAANLLAPTAIASLGSDLLVAGNDGLIYRLRDVNGDGDALDFGESVSVAEGLTSVTGIAAPPLENGECLAGDINADGSLDLADIPGFAAALVGTGQPPEPCRADMNADGLLNARDLPLFVAALLE